MKRFLSLCLAAALCLALVGCASSEKQNLKETLDEANGYTTVDYTMSDGTTLDKTVIYDKNGLVVTVLGLEGSVDNGYLTVRLENNTSSEVQMYISGVQVNGWDTSSSMWKEVSKNSMGRWSMYLYNNVEWDSIQTIKLECELMDGDYDTIDTFTTTLETSAYTGELPDEELPGDVLYEGDGITLTFGGFQQERYSSYTKMQFYVENTRSKSVTLEMVGDGFRLADGQEVDASLYEMVSAGAKDAFYIYIDQDDIYNPETRAYEYYGEDDESFDWTAFMPFEMDLTCYENYSTVLFTTTVTIEDTSVEIVDEDEAAEWDEEAEAESAAAEAAREEAAQAEPAEEDAAIVTDDGETAAQEDTTPVTDDAETAAQEDTDAAAAEEETVTAVTEDVRTA
ncbi:MAG: hypothetical protein LUG58_09385 [Clostridiales bacterium]|nr:hypothetical protein [Clostridiales bacterium]